MEGFVFFGCWFSLGSILLFVCVSVKRSVMRFGRFPFWLCDCVG